LKLFLRGLVLIYVNSKIKIGIVGLGMVGTPLMRWFEECGFKRGENLFCYDADPKKDFFDDIQLADVVFICVPTPPNPDGSCNVSIVESVVEQFSEKDTILIIKSTVPPGTTVNLAKKYNCTILFNPEFLTEAQAWEDFIRPDRQIVAYSDKEKRHFISTVLNLLPAAAFQSPGVMGTYHFHEAHSTEAELAKYAGNTFGAIKVSFSNVLADICEAVGADYENVKELVGHDRRIGRAWMDVCHGSYRGFGGYCFPKDLDALILFFKEVIANLSKDAKNKKEVLDKGLALLRSVRDYNEALLRSQGLSTAKVSSHDKDLKKQLKNLKAR